MCFISKYSPESPGRGPSKGVKAGCAVHFVACPSQRQGTPAVTHPSLANLTQGVTSGSPYALGKLNVKGNPQIETQGLLQG